LATKGTGLFLPQEVKTFSFTILDTLDKIKQDDVVEFEVGTGEKDRRQSMSGGRKKLKPLQNESDELGYMLY